MRIKPCLNESRAKVRIPCAALLLLLMTNPSLSSAVSEKEIVGDRAIPWALTFERAIEQARAERKYVMVDFYTSWCGWCRRLESQTYSDPEVIARVSQIVAVRINGDKDKALAARFGVRAFPSILFLNPDGAVKHMVKGFQAPGPFLQSLDFVFASDSEQFALETRVRFDPKDVGARMELAELLALKNEHGLAAAHLDTLLQSKWGSDQDQAMIELDKLRFLVQAGTHDGVRHDLERWISKNKRHARWGEALFLMADLCERDDRLKDARKLYRQVIDTNPDTWMAELAGARLSRLSG